MSREAMSQFTAGLAVGIAGTAALLLPLLLSGRREKPIGQETSATGSATIQQRPTTAIARDYKLFPNDANGDVLWHMRSKGDTLTRPRELDFTVILPSEEAALKCAIICLQSGFKVEVEKSEEHHKDNLDWNVLVYTTAVPTHADVTMLEQLLGKHAASLGGQTDGWSSVFVASE